MESVKLYKRILAIIIDGIFISLISFFVILSKNLTVQLVSVSIMLIYILMDHIILPHKTGFTSSRWLCNYKIRNKTTKSNPSYFQCIGRYLSLVVIEIIAFCCIFSIATSIFRKDNAAIHDLLTKTEVQPIVSSKILRFKKIVLILLTFLFFSLFVLLITIIKADEVYVQPTLHDRKNLDNYTEKPLLLIMNNDKTYYGIENFPIIQKSNINDISYQKEKLQGNENFKYLININNKEFICYIDELINTKKSSNRTLFESFMSHADLNKMAKKSLLTVEGNYSFFSPLNNYISYSLRVLDCIAAPIDRKLAFSVYNDDYFIRCFTTTKNNKLHVIELSIFSKNLWRGFSLSSKENNDESNEILLSVIQNLKNIQFENVEEIQQYASTK